MRFVLAWMLLSSFLAAPGLAARKAPPSASLERLDSLATLLMSVADGTSRCGIGSEEALRILPLLHARIDEARQDEVKRLRGRATSRAWDRCRDACHCGAWVDLVEALPKRSAARPGAKVLSRMRGWASKQGPNDVRRCAKAAESWVCSSPLLRELRAEAKP